MSAPRARSNRKGASWDTRERRCGVCVVWEQKKFVQCKIEFAEVNACVNEANRKTTATL